MNPNSSILSGGLEITCGDAAWLYSDLLGARIALPPGQKSPPPVGVTGRRAEYPPPAYYQGWFQACRDPRHVQCFNVGLRLRPEVIALDVDAYSDHGGAATLAALEAQLGKLPATFRNTRRGSANPSGHRLFRVPAGLEWRDAGPGVDTLWWGHRYLVVWPSRVEGKTYRWYGPDGRRLPFREVPTLHQLPALPPAWVEFLTKPARPVVPDGRPWDGAPPTPSELVRIRQELEAARLSVLHAAEGARNQTLNDVTYRLARLAAGSPLDPGQVVAEMVAVGEAVGLDHTEAASTVGSAMRAGARHPRGLTTHLADLAAQLRNGDRR